MTWRCTDEYALMVMMMTKLGEESKINKYVEDHNNDKKAQSIKNLAKKQLA